MRIDLGLPRNSHSKPVFYFAGFVKTGISEMPVFPVFVRSSDERHGGH
jgi:hypothetical protein